MDVYFKISREILICGVFYCVLKLRRNLTTDGSKHKSHQSVLSINNYITKNK